MAEQILYLSKDRSHVMDVEGKVVYIRNESGGKTFYATPSLEKGRGKVCVSFEPKKICIDWDEKKYCIGWDTIEVCVHWELE